MSNLAQDVSELKKDPGRLPSQTVPNSRGNVSVMGVVDVDATLRESAYWVNKMLETKARYNEEEPSPESTGRAEDFGSLSPKEEPAATLGPDALGTARPGPVLMAENFETHGSSCSMQIIALEGHVINKDEPGDRLVASPTQNDPTMRNPLATSQDTPPGKSKDPGGLHGHLWYR
ncbi:unnamed protein product [Rhodiola kirilowii]